MISCGWLEIPTTRDACYNDAIKGAPYERHCTTAASAANSSSLQTLTHATDRAVAAGAAFLWVQHWMHDGNHVGAGAMLWGADCRLPPEMLVMRAPLHLHQCMRVAVGCCGWWASCTICLPCCHRAPCMRAPICRAGHYGQCIDMCKRCLTWGCGGCGKCAAASTRIGARSG